MNENPKDISSLLNEAFDAYKGVENKEYAPIFNSYIMLKEIQKHHRESVKELGKERLYKLDVGVLAAKALDFDEQFFDYSMLLHDVWDSFLSFISIQRTIPAYGPERESYDFYIKQRYTPNQAKDHMRGIDFLKNIDANFILYKDSDVAQWKHLKVNQGDYYSEPAKKPNCLGIHHEQEDYQGRVGDREEHIFSPVHDITCLKSFAAAVLDTWSIKKQYHQTSGGCIQYFNAINKNDFKLGSTPP